MTSPAPRPGSAARRRPLILFLLLTVFTFAGPLAVFLVGRGGGRPTWPPDRPVEWRVFLGVTVGFAVLFLACMIDAGRDLIRLRREAAGRGPGGSS